jgi:hypothetical protein
MTVSRAVATLILAGAVTAACTSGGSKGHTSAPPSVPGPSTGAVAACTAATAKRADSVVVTGKTVKPSCVKLPRGGGLSIINGNSTALHGALDPPSKTTITVDLPHKNSVYPFTTKKAGRYEFSCSGCANRLSIFVS